MIVHWDTKQIELAEYDLLHGFPCPVCGHPYIPNGTGPSNSDLLSRLLKGSPSELVVGGIPPRFHDSAYLLCPEGWTVVFKHSFTGKLYTAKNKKTSDKCYLALMKDMHQDAQGIAKAMLWVIAKRNYLAVKFRGKSSYRHKHS